MWRHAMKAFFKHTGRRGTGAQRELLRRLLAEKTYPELLGLDVEDSEDWFAWFVASSLFAKPISAAAARTAAIHLFKEKIASPAAIERCGWDGLVTILDLGGYVRYDFSTATKLLAVAAALPGDRLRWIVTEAPSAQDIMESLTRIKGIGPKTVEIFLRELRGVGGPRIPLSEDAKAAAKRLRLGRIDRGPDHGSPCGPRPPCRCPRPRCDPCRRGSPDGDVTAATSLDLPGVPLEGGVPRG